MRNISISVWPAFDQAVHWLAEWLGASNPAEVLTQLFFTSIAGMSIGGGRKSEVAIIAWMMGLQLAFGLVLALLASWQLRPIFRRQDESAGIRAIRVFFLTRKSRKRLAAIASNEDGRPVQESRIAPVSPARQQRWHRPALGDRPMIWKEFYTSRPRGLTRLVGVLLTLIAGGFLAYNTYWLADLAIREIWDSGNAPRTDYTAWAHRNAFMWFLHGIVPLVYVVGILGVAGAAAASITSEHEEDTWVSLTATDLTAREIVFAKMFGAMKRGLMFGGVIVFLATLGALVGSIKSPRDPLVDSGHGYLCLGRRGARTLDLNSNPHHLASPVLDHRKPASHQRFRTGSAQYALPIWIRSPALARILALRDVQTTAGSSIC